MDRRDFLKRTAAGTSLMAVSGIEARAARQKVKRVETRLPADGYLKEPAREIPVVAGADVVVVGGGPAGFAAAVSAARQGSSVILLERHNHLGGLWTGGLVLPVLNTRGAGPDGSWTKVVHGISDDVCGRLFGMGMCINEMNPMVDPEACKYVLDEMCRVMKRVNIYLFCSQKQIQRYLDYFVSGKGCNWNLLTWHKTNPIPACGNKYLNDTEYIMFFREKGVKIYGSYETKRTFYTTLRNQEDNLRYKHPTVKPLQIVRNLVVNSTELGGGNS